MRIYVAGPYSAPTAEERLANTIRAMEAGRELVLLGHAPYIPHLSHYFDEWLQSIGEEIAYDEYIEWGMAILEGCQAVLAIGSSPGTDREVALAREIGIPVFTSIIEGVRAFWMAA